MVLHPQAIIGIELRDGDVEGEGVKEGLRELETSRDIVRVC